MISIEAFGKSSIRNGENEWLNGLVADYLNLRPFPHPSGLSFFCTVHLSKSD